MMWISDAIHGMNIDHPSTAPFGLVEGKGPSHLQDLPRTGATMEKNSKQHMGVSQNGGAPIACRFRENPI